MIRVKKLLVQNYIKKKKSPSPTQHIAQYVIFNNNSLKVSTVSQVLL